MRGELNAGESLSYFKYELPEAPFSPVITYHSEGSLEKKEIGFFFVFF